MTTLQIDTDTLTACQVSIDDLCLAVQLHDGRTISVPLAWYPRLQNGSAEERANWRLTGSGEGIHWPDLDEDISVAGLIAGKPSGESQRSFQRWLEEQGQSR